MKKWLCALIVSSMVLGSMTPGVLWAKEITEFPEIVVPEDSETTEEEKPEITAPEVAVTEAFSDVYNDWYTEYVQYVYDTGLMSGMQGTTKFAPNANISKAQVAQVLYNLEGKPEVTENPVFEELKDVYDAEWYAAAVSWA